MAKDKLILDIRLFESDYENVMGTSLPSQSCEIYKRSKAVNHLSSRIARKLREFGFVTGKYDHVYINLTTFLPQNAIRYSPRNPDSWMKYIDYGLDPENVNGKSESEQQEYLKDIIFKVIYFISNGSQDKIVDDVKELINLHGSNLELFHKEKDTKSYNVRITYKIRPNGKGSEALIYFKNKKTNRCFETSIPLNFYTDIYSLISNISVSKENITLKPRPSFKAKIYSKSYEVPINIKIDEA